MFMWTAEHVLDALDECLFGGSFVGEGIENGLCGDRGITSHSGTFSEELVAKDKGILVVG